jgi:cytochrome P450
MSTPTDTEKPVPSGLGLSPFDPTYQEKPYEVLQDLRERAPVHYDEFFRSWWLTRWEEVDRVLRDRTMSSDPRKAPPDSLNRTVGSAFMEGGREPSILFLDPPDHTRLRGLVSKAFTPRSVEQLRPRIQEITDGLLDELEGRESFDLMESFANPLPTVVIAEMLGVDTADRDDFKRWSDIGVMSFDPTLSEEGKKAVLEARDALDAYFQRTIAERRAEPRDDLISSLIAVEEAGDQLTTMEIITMCGLLLAAGNVTTTDLIGNGVLALLRHHDQLQKLRYDPSLIKNAIEEILRYDSPVVISGRLAMDDVELGGCPVKKGQSINTSLGAANHDPSVHPDPEKFDITRENPQHVSFGGGAHYCLGAPLARLEAQIALSALFQRFPTLRLADEPLTWKTVPGFRGLARLQVLV